MLCSYPMRDVRISTMYAAAAFGALCCCESETHPPFRSSAYNTIRHVTLPAPFIAAFAPPISSYSLQLYCHKHSTHHSTNARLLAVPVTLSTHRVTGCRLSRSDLLTVAAAPIDIVVHPPCSFNSPTLHCSGSHFNSLFLSVVSVLAMSALILTW